MHRLCQPGTTGCPVQRGLNAHIKRDDAFFKEAMRNFQDVERCYSGRLHLVVKACPTSPMDSQTLNASLELWHITNYRRTLPPRWKVVRISSRHGIFGWYQLGVAAFLDTFHRIISRTSRAVDCSLIDEYFVEWGVSNWTSFNMRTGAVRQISGRNTHIVTDGIVAPNETWPVLIS